MLVFRTAQWKDVITALLPWPCPLINPATKQRPVHTYCVLDHPAEPGKHRPRGTRLLTEEWKGVFLTVLSLPHWQIFTGLPWLDHQSLHTQPRVRIWGAPCECEGVDMGGGAGWEPAIQGVIGCKLFVCVLRNSVNSKALEAHGRSYETNSSTLTPQAQWNTEVFSPQTSSSSSQAFPPLRAKKHHFTPQFNWKHLWITIDTTLLSVITSSDCPALTTLANVLHSSSDLEACSGALCFSPGCLR